ncbi:MAG: ABC transporter substrate-binding protein [Candidatus Margulisbacteria bacterium]|nr:ABC transporter substrate-binding protein [Candidatus Margulisiibacteriota bacterium]
MKKLLASLFLLLLVGTAGAKEYDGIWFLGFNTEREPFNNLKVRQAVAHALDKEYIARTIVKDDIVPADFIPPGLPGYDPALRPYKFNPKYARTLLQRAKYPPTDPRLKGLTLLHTDGDQTVAIARQIVADLKEIGLKVEPVMVSYRDQERWNRELASGQHPLFLLGYKADSDELFTAEVSAADTDSGQLLSPLFQAGGPANFGRFSDPTLNMYFDQLSVISPALGGARESKLRAIGRLLYKQLPAIVLFYIEKL